MAKIDMEKIVNVAKRRGFAWQGSEIYGGVGAIWHFGPLGVEMKRAIKDLWWKRFVTERTDVVGMEGAVIMHPKVWEASGHLKSFTDPLVECRKCHKRFREDHFSEVKSQKSKVKSMEDFTDKQKEIVVCEDGKEHEFTEAKDFNLMFKTFLGPVDDREAATYLRPETAQAMFTDFKLVAETCRMKVPFGIAQIGKCFRNEITTGDFIFRSREFEIAEVEYFVAPGEDEKAFKMWLAEWKKFYLDLGITKDKLREKEHEKAKLAHYSKRTVDIEYEFPFGWSELAGVANRTDYDLSQHEKFSGQDLKYFDLSTNSGQAEKYIPYVIEPTLGIERVMLAILVDGYSESDGSDGREKGEIVLKMNAKIAPMQVGIFPLVKKDKLPEIAGEIEKILKNNGLRVYYDETGSIGRRYRRQDEIGTPWCVTVDFQSLEDKTVTVRDRDSLKQERVDISVLLQYFNNKLE